MRRAVLLLACLAAAARAQPVIPEEDLAPPPPDTTAARLATSRAWVALLTEDGLGAGVATRLRLTDDVAFTAEASLSGARDAREQRFFVGFFGDTVTPFKRSYAVLLPMHVGLERRLFRAHIEDTFRPFVSVAGGPTLALQWPYFDDADRDGVRDPGEARLGALEGIGSAQARLGGGVSAGLGAWFGRGPRVQGLRLGVALHYFPGAVDLLELDPAVVRPSRRTFVSPTVSFHVARLGEGR
jgi:hypothetical protein